MIIYEATIPHFLNISKTPDKLATEIKGNLKANFGISVGHSEVNSWMQSLPRVAKLIKEYKEDKRKILIEFNVPTTKQRIDFIILGKDKDKKPSAWLLELKQWSNITEVDWNEFKVGRYNDTHPSGQARDYSNRLLSEMGMDGVVNIKSSAYLHNLNNNNSPLFHNKYKEMLKASFLYSEPTEGDLSNMIDEHTIFRDGMDSFEHFKDAHWKPSKKFQEILNNEFKEMTLVGTQKEIFEKIEKFIKNKKKDEKMTFLISGDPGSGKTIVAFKLLMLIAKELQMSIQLMIPGQEVRDAFKYELRRKSLAHWISGSVVKNNNEAAIIDEAHKAVGRDSGLVNYKRFYEKLNFAIIFIDDDQVINRKGITKKQVKKIALESNHTVHEYRIEENFRNRGERSLLDWVDHIFYKRKTRNREFEYSQSRYINKANKYKVFSYKNDDNFIKRYYQYHKKNKSTRITSLWHQTFHNGPADENGFVPKTVKVGEHLFTWNPNDEWFQKLSAEDKKTYNYEVKKFASMRRNFLVGSPQASYMAYFNHIQGYEFENIFVYIPNIFTYENNELIFHRNRLAKEVKTSQTWSPTSKAKELGDRDPYTLNKRYFLNRIKVMLTRGTKSTHIFAEDKALNDYIFDSID